jgi:hypothetical protein
VRYSSTLTASNQLSVICSRHDHAYHCCERVDGDADADRYPRDGTRRLRRPRPKPLQRTSPYRRSSGRHLRRIDRPDRPAASKTDIVTPGFSPEEAGTIDDHLNRSRRNLPLNFVVTNIQPAPNNLAGATLATVGNPRQSTYARPIVLVDQGGRWLITHDSAVIEANAFWSAEDRYMGGFVK